MTRSAQQGALPTSAAPVHRRTARRCPSPHVAHRRAVPDRPTGRPATPEPRARRIVAPYRLGEAVSSGTLGRTGAPRAGVSADAPLTCGFPGRNTAAACHDHATRTPHRAPATQETP